MTQVIGAVAFGFIIATVTIIIETMDPEASAKRRKKDELLDYLNERGYSRDLQKRARKHFHYFQAKTSAFAEMHVVAEVSANEYDDTFFTKFEYLTPPPRPLTPSPSPLPPHPPHPHSSPIPSGRSSSLRAGMALSLTYGCSDTGCPTNL